MSKYTDEATIHAVTDEKGHPAQLQIKMLPAWARQIEVLVQSGKLPYETKGDFIRDAIYKHLQWIDRDYVIDGYDIASIQLRAELDTAKKNREDHIRIMKDLEKEVELFSKDGATVEAYKAVRRALWYVDQMPDGYWKTKRAEEIKARYAGLKACMPKAKLLATEKETESVDWTQENACVSEEDYN